MLGTLLVFAQVVAAPLQSATEERPVRLWLGASPVTTGSEMPVYVAAANDGYLLVLRVGTDGRVSVVFPADPKSQGRVTRGTYELREAGGRPALVVNEGRGTGLVFAALSEKPFRFGEFSRTGRWDSALLVASHAGADGPGTLMDIAQRMLGDGWFNSAFALYTVRAQSDALLSAQRRAAPQTPGLQPRTDARGQNGEDAQATIAACHGCTIVYQTVLPTPVIEQTVVERSFIEPAWILANSCNVRLGNCGFFGDTGIDRGRGLPPLKTEGVCSIGIDCPRSIVPTGMAVKMRTTSLTMSPITRPTPPAPQLPPGDYAVPAPVLASTTVASRVILSKAAPISSGPVVRRVIRPAGGGGMAAPQARTAPVVQRTGGAMTARQSGTALRAARILPRR